MLPRWVWLLWLALVAAPVAGQDGPPTSPILTLDQERLFQGTEPAALISRELERLTTELAAENRHIEAELSAEELDLTEARATLEPEEFRKLANAFDAKVQLIRNEQDAKERALQQRREEDRQTFLRQITPVLAEIARERGGLVVLDRRTVILSADAVDITDEAIERINAAFTRQRRQETPPAPALDAPAPETPAPDIMPAPETPAPDSPAGDTQPAPNTPAGDDQRAPEVPVE